MKSDRENKRQRGRYDVSNENTIDLYDAIDDNIYWLEFFIGNIALLVCEQRNDVGTAIGGGKTR